MWAMWRRSGGTSGWWSGWRPGWGWRWRFRAACRPPRRRRGRWPVSRSALAGERTLTLVNRTRETIWPAAWPGSVSGRTGWTLAAGSSVSIVVPDRWNARLWGRTGCRFDAWTRRLSDRRLRRAVSVPGVGSDPGDAGRVRHGLLRSPRLLRRVDGRRLESADVHHHRARQDQESDLRQRLRAGCRVHVQRSDARWRCRSTAAAGSSPAFRRVHGFTPPATAAAAPTPRGVRRRATWPINYARVFKRAEPYAYSWSGDDATSVFTCAGGCDYRITFGVTPPGIGGPPG